MANGKRLPHPGRGSGAGKPLQLRNQRRRCAGPMIYSAEELYCVVDGVAGWMRGGMGEFANRRDRLESARNGQPSVPFSLGRLGLVLREQTPLGIPACATPPPCPVPSSSIRRANTANYSPSAPKPDNRTAPACATIRYAPRQSVLGTADTTRGHLDRADGALRDDLEWVGCVGGN